MASRRPAGMLAMVTIMTFAAIAFGLILGSITVATAIAFGIGARDVAGRLVQRWVNALDER